MAETKRWSGNTTTNISLYDGELDELMEFVRSHIKIFIFGKGKIGKALGHYCKQAGILVEGHITTSDWEQFIPQYKQTKIGILIGVSDENVPSVMNVLSTVVSESDIYTLTSNMRESMGNVFSKDVVEKNFWLNIYVTNHCNLNCRSCSAFAPICQPDYYDVNQFKQDIIQIKKLNLTNINVMKFTGAEALLHPQILALFKITREIFPQVDFECYTNGLVLVNMSNEDLQLLKELRVVLVITEYPLDKLNLTNVYKRLDKIGVIYNVIFSEGQKYFSKRPLNFEKNTPKYLFYNCPRYKMCDSLFLFNGRLYKCIYALSAGYVNQAFDKELEVQKGDYVDIYSSTADDVYQYAISRIPFCGYCSQIEETIPWGLSTKRIEEWT